MIQLELIGIVIWSSYSGYFNTNWTVGNGLGTFLVGVLNTVKRVEVQPSSGSAHTLYYRLLALDDASYFYQSPYDRVS